MSRWQCLNCGVHRISIKVVKNVIHIYCDECRDIVTMLFESEEEANNITIGEIFDFYEREKGVDSK